MYDVIVIGAGVEGLGAAYNLAKANYKTLLLEQVKYVQGASKRFSLPHSRGSSHGQGRTIRKAYNKIYYAQMMPEAYRMWEELAREEHTKLLVTTGVLLVEQGPSQEVENTAQALSKIGAIHQMYNTEQLRARLPQMFFPDGMEGVFDPDGGVLLADRILKGLLNQFMKNGGEVRDAEPVEAIRPGTTVTIDTTEGQYQGRSVVVCAGPWTDKLVSPLGLHLPLKPIRVGVYYWRQTTPSYSAVQKFPASFFPSREGGIYTLPALEYPDHVKVCLHNGPAIDPDRRDDTESDAPIVKTLTDFVKRHLPGLETKPSIVETCIYTNTPDDDFILDTHPHWTNIVVGAGFSGHGFKLAPVVGKVLSELATGRSPSYDLSPFRIDRFFQKSAKL